LPIKDKAALLAEFKKALDALLAFAEVQGVTPAPIAHAWKLYKAALPDPHAAPYAADVAVLHVLAERLRSLTQKPDISGIMGDIDTLLDESIIGQAIRAPITDDFTELFDLRAIDFDKLSAAFRKGQKRTQVQMLRAKVEQKLGEMIRRNPTRVDLLEKFQSMIAE
jgi:type I restriction enzyme R subunit